MVYELGVLQDYLTDLRMSQMVINTKQEFTADDLDDIVETLNRCEMLVLSLIGSQGANADMSVGGVDIDLSNKSPEEVKAELMNLFGGAGTGVGQFGVVILPDDGVEGEFGEYGEDAPISEDQKYSADDEPKVKS